MGMDDCDGVIWFDGEFVPWKDAKVHVLTHTLHYGMGVFEGIRAYKSSSGTAIFRLSEHIDRLYASAHILNMKIPFNKTVVIDACHDAVKNNKDELSITLKGRPFTHKVTSVQKFHAKSFGLLIEYYKTVSQDQQLKKALVESGAEEYLNA